MCILSIAYIAQSYAHIPIGCVRGCLYTIMGMTRRHDKLLVMIKGALVEVKAKRKRGQPWFTREIAKLRKIANGAERRSLRFSDKVAKRGKGESMLRRGGCTREQWVKLK